VTGVQTCALPISSSINALGVATPYSIAAGAVAECLADTASHLRCRTR
jgi:hypothetical protein